MLKEKRFHVLFVADEAVVGGATEALVELCQQLMESERYRCTVLTAQRSRLNKRLEALGVRTVVTRHGDFLVARPHKTWKAPLKWGLYLAKYLYGLMESVRIAESVIDFDDVDIIHTNVPRNDLGIQLARRHSVTHVVHLRECSFSHFRCWSYRRDPVVYLANGADAFVGISRFVTDYWEKLGLPVSKLHTIYDGVKVPDLRIPPEGSFNDGKLHLIFLGGYVEPKGTMDAVKAIAMIEANYPGDVTLDIYGGGSSEFRTVVKEFVDSAGLSGIVGLHEELYDIWSVIPQYDVGLACSMDEGFGRTVIEFQSCGVPPIVSDSGAFPELVSDGVNGLIYKKSDGPKALALRIQELVDNRTLRFTLSAGALKSAARFSAKKNGKAIMELYDELIADKS